MARVRWVVASVVVFCARPALAWSSNPAVDDELGVAAATQTSVALIDDGAGGLIGVWVDRRNGTQDIYAQRLGPNGTKLWTTDVAVCSAVGEQTTPQVVSDGAGGAIVAWADARVVSQQRIFAQRVLADGTLAWAANGIEVSSEINVAFTMGPVESDHSGGAFIAMTRRSGADANVQVQRISANGARQWSDSGAPAGPSQGVVQSASDLLADGAGGVFVGWSQTPGINDVMAQRLDASGSLQWAFGGVRVSTSPGNLSGSFVSDAAGGIFVSWTHVSGQSEIVRARRVSSAGVPQGNEVVAIDELGIQHQHRSVQDGSGGMVVLFNHNAFGVLSVKGQRIDATGARLWGRNGKQIGTSVVAFARPTLVRTDSARFVTFWPKTGGPSLEIHAQSVDGTGTPVWSSDVTVSAVASGGYAALQSLAFSGGRAVVAFHRNSSTVTDVFAKLLNADGTLGDTPADAGTDTGSDAGSDAVSGADGSDGSAGGASGASGNAGSSAGGTTGGGGSAGTAAGGTSGAGASGGSSARGTGNAGGATGGAAAGGTAGAAVSGSAEDDGCDCRSAVGRRKRPESPMYPAFALGLLMLARRRALAEQDPDSTGD